MIILDTNIISEIMKSSPSLKVMTWLDKEESSQFFITTITIAEISYGLHALPQGKKRNQLENAFNAAISEAFKHRILSFDESAAHLYGRIMGDRKNIGRPLNIADGQIAAITFLHEASLVTRNMKDFIDCGIKLINPFD